MNNYLFNINTIAISKIFKRSWVRGLLGFQFLSNAIATDWASKPPIIIGSLLPPSISLNISA